MFKTYKIKDTSISVAAAYDSGEPAHRNCIGILQESGNGSTIAIPNDVTWTVIATMVRAKMNVAWWRLTGRT